MILTNIICTKINYLFFFSLVLVPNIILTLLVNIIFKENLQSLKNN